MQQLAFLLLFSSFFILKRERVREEIAPGKKKRESNIFSFFSPFDSDFQQQQSSGRYIGLDSSHWKKKKRKKADKQCSKSECGAVREKKRGEKEEKKTKQKKKKLIW